MPKPVFNRKKKSVGKPAKKKKHRSTALHSAEKAVETFEEEFGELQAMRNDFSAKFPKAAKALNDIQQQEDLVHETIKEAHVAVQKAKVSVGPFKLQRKWQGAGYDPEMFTDICSSTSVSGTMLIRLLANGVIKLITPDNGTRKAAGRAVTFLAKNPKLGDLFSSSWKEELEKTPAVTDPAVTDPRI